MGDFTVRVQRNVSWSLGATLLGALAVASACSSTPPQGPAAALAGAAGTSASAGGACASVACGTGGMQLVLGESGKPSQSSGGTNGAVGTTYGGSAGASSNGSCQSPALVSPGCVAALEVESDGSCNGLDDDCDGSVDEGCPCKPGEVQPCFLGPPGRHRTGACSDGAQTCLRGGEFAARWGECKGGITPAPESCDGLDNDCNGCTDDLDGCAAQWSCPGPGDPRTPDGAPLASYPLHGRNFFSGAAKGWSWAIQGGPCDELVPRSPSFVLDGASSESATFTPKLSGDYTVTLTVTPESGPPFSCSWIVHIVGPGLRIEMCYPESTTQDLDLYVKQPGQKTPWFTDLTQLSPALDQCSWANCEASLRGDSVRPERVVPRADWGYLDSPLSLCENTLQGPTWQGLGHCASPRLDIDNNLSEATGVPENINVDAPRDNETFRIMVANFSGTDAHPLINVYCDGRRTASLGEPPDQLPMFVGLPGASAIGAMWRAADVTTHVVGSATTCTVESLHPPGATSGFDLTVDDPRY